MFASLNAYPAELKVPEHLVRFITVTAPGADSGLPWDESYCSHRGPHTHSGPAGCRVVSDVAERWNERAPTWWTRELHHPASQAVARQCGRRPNLLARVYELQRRGVLHLHIVVGYSTLAEKRSADLYVAELASRAPAAGFGFVDRKRQVLEPSAAAAYLSAYFVDGKKGKATLRESVQSGQLPRSIVYLAPRLSRRTGITMRTLRCKRFLWRRGRLDLCNVLGMRYDDFCRAERRGVTTNQLVDAHCREPAP